MTTIHVGKSRVETSKGSDASTIPAGTLSAVSSAPTVVSATVDPATNNVTLAALKPDNGVTTSIVYSAPGYTNTTQSVTVPTPPSIVITDGPEQ